MRLRARGPIASLLASLGLLGVGAASAHAEWTEWTFAAELDAAYVSNLNRAATASEHEWDLGFQPALVLGRSYQLAERTRLSASGRFGGEIYSRAEELAALVADGRLALLHKTGLGDAPWLRVHLSGGYRHLDGRERRGPRLETGLELGKRLSARLDARLGYAWERRFAGSGPAVVAGADDDVFEQRRHRVFADARFQLTPRLLVSGGFAYRRGDFDANARRNRTRLLGRGGVEAVARDRVFGGWVYRIEGDGYAPFAGLSWSLGRRTAIDLVYRFEYGEGSALRYRNHGVAAALLYRY